MGKPPGFPPLFRIPPWLPYRILCAKANSNQGVALSSFPRVNKAKSHVTERWRHDDPDDLAACLHRLATDWPASSAMWVRAFSDRFTNLCSRIESVKEFWRSCGEANQPTWFWPTFEKTGFEVQAMAANHSDNFHKKKNRPVWQLILPSFKLRHSCEYS